MLCRGGYDEKHRSGTDRNQRNPASLRNVRVFSRPNAEASFAFTGLASPILFGEGIKETRHRCAMCGFFME